MPGLRKVLVTIDSEGIETEHYGKIFDDILHEYRGQNVQLYLRKDIETIIGFITGEKVLIGNIKSSLDKKDYYTAYDKLF